MVLAGGVATLQYISTVYLEVWLHSLHEHSLSGGVATLQYISTMHLEVWLNSLHEHSLSGSVATSPTLACPI